MQVSVFLLAVGP